MSPEVLPPGARLLHIGLPKTGTTALQQAAANNRGTLLQHGVRYPGNAVSHRLEVAALMGRDTIWTARGPVFPTRKAWTTLLREIEADPLRRALVSHESAAACTDEQAARFRDGLGSRLHVVVTVRNYAEFLTSRWQQYVKSGLALSFEAWLTAVLTEPPRSDITPGFHDNSDAGLIVDRWCRVVGPDRVTVVVSDKSRPRSVAEAFGGLLGAPPDLFHLARRSRAVNRSLSAAEAELLRGLNAAARKDPRLWSRHQDLVRSGVISRLQSARLPRPDERTLRLPPWAAPAAQQQGRRQAEQIAESGCHVVGDLTALHSAVPTAEESAGTDHVPIDAALEALLGMMQAGVREPPRNATGRPLGAEQTSTRWGSWLHGVLPLHRLPPTVRRQVHFVRRAGRNFRRSGRP